MLLVCESCGTNFKANAVDIGIDGRFVRCIRCGHEWLATASPEEIKNELTIDLNSDNGDGHFINPTVADNTINQIPAGNIDKVDTFDSISFSDDNNQTNTKINQESEVSYNNIDDDYSTQNSRADLVNSDFNIESYTENLEEKLVSKKVLRFFLFFIFILNIIALIIVLLLYNAERIILEYPQVANKLYHIGLYQRNSLIDQIRFKAVIIKQNNNYNSESELNNIKKESNLEFILANDGEKIILIRSVKVVTNNGGEKNEENISVHQAIRPKSELGIQFFSNLISHDSVISVYINNDLLIHQKPVNNFMN